MKTLFFLLLFSFNAQAERIIVNFLSLSEAQAKAANNILNTHALVSKPAVFTKPPQAQFTTLDYMNNAKIMEMFEPLNASISSIKRQVKE